MAAPTTVTWEMDGHTQAKHVILRKYLNAWIPILASKRDNKVLLVDGFAGPGEYVGNKEGSPLIMLRAFLEHPSQNRFEGSLKFLFIEEKHSRYQHLQQRIAALKQEIPFPPNITYEVKNGRFVDMMQQLLATIPREKNPYTASFFFVDPFGYSHTPMHLLKDLLSFPRSEVLVTVMTEEINRFLNVDYQTKEQHYDKLFGTSAWRPISSSTSTMDPYERMQQLHDLYRNQLLTVAGVKYVRSFRMRNKHNATDYFLFFGTSSIKGLTEMKRSMWKVDATGAFEFSDFTNPFQPLLLQEPNYEDLRQRLIQRFRGQTVSLDAIEEYVLAETPYCVYKQEGLRVLECASPPKIQVFAQDPKRKRGHYKDHNLRIRFLS
ncbi:three-Cys-motif partner protein TcmP [Ktedonospora formicarum]|uniref:Three-Cys-motif partner protein TcmP n=1 Tax=Ktedonospora formicarum TaxID=2778364 RepID=A0A8J3I5R4_9CHLR|nr:three-Cys-motif partner protein TcmP [Ktedonospora formicarum]GHO49146.1 hypothetical protein KSX_73090 [Ktedonospora formicarum]